VLAIMPLVFVAIISLFNPGYIGRSCTAKVGHALLAYHSSRSPSASMILNRLVNVEE
jgi:Flp pilus assembly protein TadB